MDDKLISRAIECLRKNKNLTLRAHLPSEELPDGRITFLCDYQNANADNEWLSFNVFIEKSDLIPTHQKIDDEAKINRPFKPEDLFMIRIAYRIYCACREIKNKSSGEVKKPTNKEIADAYFEGFFWGW